MHTLLLSLSYENQYAGESIPIAQIPIYMTNRRFGLIKRGPTYRLRNVAAQALNQVREAMSVYKDDVRLYVHSPDGSRRCYVCTYSPNLLLPQSRRDNAIDVGRLSRMLTWACVRIYRPIFDATRSSKPCSYTVRKQRYRVNYGGEGIITVNPKLRTIRYEYKNLSAKNFSRTLMARYMAHYIDWQHDVCVMKATDLDGLREALHNLELDTCLGGGSVYLQYPTKQLLGLVKINDELEETLPF